MKSIICLTLAVLAIASAGCCQHSVEHHSTGEQNATDQPNWELARQELRIDPADVRKEPSPEERGARLSDSVTVGDSISITCRGWIYTWKVESIEDSELVLKQVEAKRVE